MAFPQISRPSPGPVDKRNPILTWGPSSSPTVDTFYNGRVQGVSPHSIASQQQFHYFQEKFREIQLQVQQEQQRVQKSESEKATVEQCLRDTELDLQGRGVQLRDLSHDLEVMRDKLSCTESRAREQWAAVISLSELLRCQGSGEQVDVAKLFREKEEFRNEVAHLGQVVTSKQAAIDALSRDVDRVQLQFRERVNRNEASSAIHKQRFDEVTSALNNANLRYQNLENYKASVERDLNWLRRQTGAGQGRTLVNAVPEKKHVGRNRR